jgi:predicted DNA binding protein
VAVRGDESFYVYVRDDLRDADQRLLGTYRGDSLVIVPPVTYRADRSMLFTLVGTAEAVQAAVSETPDDVAVDVLSVRPYDAGAVDSLLRLTDRQRAAVRVAVDVGYYGARRAGSVAAVAEELGCSTATAAEHLRKAEAEIMSRVVDRRL